MQTHKKLKARILSLALSVAMVTTMMPMNVFAAEGGTAPGTSSVGTIQSFDKLEDRFTPSVGENAPDYVYGLSVALGTPEADLNLPDELTAMVARAVTAPAEDKPVVDSGKPSEPTVDETIPNEDKPAESEAVPDEDTSTDDTVSGNQPASPSDAKEEVKEEIKDEDVPLAPEPEQDEETTVTTVEQETVPVTWNSDKEYVSDENGKFIYTAVLPEGYILADGVELPQIYVYVGRQARAVGGAAITVNGTAPYTLDGAGLQQAFTDIADNGTITIGGNITANVSITLDAEKSVTLDLAGKTVTITGDKRHGFNMPKTSITIMDSSTGGKLAVTAASVADGSGEGEQLTVGIYCKNITVQSGEVAATSGAGSSGGHGILAVDTVTISGGKVTAVAKNGPNNSIGILAKCKIAVSAGIVNATAGNANASYGLAAQLSNNFTEIEITGGTVTATAGEAVTQSYGILSAGSLTISGTSTIVNATGKTVSNSSGSSIGIYSSGVSGQSTALNISGGTINATGGTGGMMSLGINFNEHAATISGGTVTATSAAGSNFSFGLAGGMNAPLTITGGTVTATGGANGINTFSTFSVSGTSTVFAKGGTAAISSTGTLTLTDREVKYKIGNDFTGETNVASNKIYEGAAGTTTEAKDVRMIKKPLVLSSIAISGTHKTAYKYGETFDKTNMIVTASYSNGTNAAVTDYTFSPTTALTMSDSKVVVSYTENGVTKTADVTITMSKADATAAMKTVSTNVSKDGKTGATVTLPTKQAGVTYGTPTAGGTITMSNMSINGDTLTYTAPASTAGQTGTITVPVTGATNYNDYSITVTVTSVAKTPVTITGLTAATGLVYNGSAQIGYTGTVVVQDNKVPVSELVYTYTSTDSGTYNSTTAPTNVGAYKLVVSVADSNATYLGTHADINFTIGKATITITADNKSAYVGDTKPALTYTATSLASGDTLVTAPTLTYETEPDMSKAGSVKIKASGAVVPNTDNYESAITYVDGTLTISNKSSGGGGGGSSSGGGGSSSSSTITKPTEPVTGSSNTNATVDDKGNATVNVTDKNIADAVQAAKDAANKKGVNAGEVTAVINVTTPAGSNPNTVTVNLPKTVQDQIIRNKIGNVAIVIDKPDISIGMTLATITEMNKQAKADIQLSATRTDATKLSTEAKNAIGNRPAFDLKATYASGAKSITNFGTGTVSVAIPYTLQKGEVAGGLYAVYVDGNGKVTHLTNSSYDAENKVLRFSTNHFSVYGIGYKAPVGLTDIANHWAKTDIEFVVGRGLMSGTSNTTFAPNGSMTRGMFVTALGRLAGVDTNSYKTSKFADVKADAYYAPYVNWAAEKGITNGTTATTFSPDNTVTRQEMAVFMSNYAKAMGYKVPETRAAVTFADNGSIGSWAAAAVKQMQMAGVLNGKNSNNFDPTGTATRAEVAAVLHRYVELVIDRSTAQGLDTNDSGSAMMYENGKMVKSASRTVGSATYNFNANGEAALLPADSKKTGTYTVQKGDSFSRIASKVGCTIAELEQLNGKSRYDTIYAGQTLKVPQK